MLRPVYTYLSSQAFAYTYLTEYANLLTKSKGDVAFSPSPADELNGVN